MYKYCKILIQYKFFIILFLIILSNTVFGQNNKEIKDLKKELTQSSDTIRVNLFIEISKLYIFHNKDSAFYYIGMALEEAERIKSQKSVAKVKNLSGYYYYLAERYEDAKIILHEAEAYFDSVGSKAGLISCYDKLGLIYLRISNNPKSFEYYTKELKLAEETNNTLAQANAINNIAIFYYNEKIYDAALKQYLQALEINKINKNEKGVGVALNNIGEIYKIKQNFAQAFENYFEAKRIFETNEHTPQLAYCLSNIGETYMLKGELEQALSSVLEAQKIFEQLSDTYGLAETYNNLGEICQKKKNYQEATKNYNKSLKYANQIQSLEHIKDNYLKLSELYSEKQDIKTSLVYYKKYTNLKDSLQTFINSQIINQLKINYETEKKDKKIKLLSAESKLNKLKSLQKTIIIVILFTGFVSQLIILVVVFIQKKKKNEAYNNLVVKNIEVMKSHDELIETKVKLEMLLQDKKVKKKASESTDKYNKSNLNEDQKLALFNELILLMEEEKYYLQKDIKLNKIAKLLGTNNLYLSQVINQKANTNFNNFINYYRINEARKHLSDPNYQNLSIEGISYEVGFKSKSTFNIAFKKHTGITPSFFRAKSQKKLKKNKPIKN